MVTTYVNVSHKSKCRGGTSLIWDRDISSIYLNQYIELMSFYYIKSTLEEGVRLWQAKKNNQSNYMP